MWLYVLIVVALLALLIYFNESFCALLGDINSRISSLWNSFSTAKKERMEGVRKALPPAVAQRLYDQGYEGSVPWTDVIQTSLDPSTFSNHAEFVKDVRRFSSGANFTSVSDDNTNADFVNFRGLRRPEHVPIGPTARQVPDIDETVLMRNKPFRW